MGGEDGHNEVNLNLPVPQMSIGKRNLQLHNENRNESKDEVRPVVIEVGTDGVRALDSSEEGGRARGEGIAISDVELGGRPLGAGNGDGARGLPVQAASTIVQLYELELRLRADLPDHTHALPKGAAVLPQSSAVCSRDVQTAGVGRRLCRTPSSAARPASGVRRQGLLLLELDQNNRLQQVNYCF